MGSYWSRLTSHDDSTMMVLAYLEHLENNPSIYTIGSEIDVVGLPSLRVDVIEPWMNQDTGKPANQFANPAQIPYITYEYTGDVMVNGNVESGHWFIKFDIIKDSFLVVV
ncbi:hypothetical protein F-liban_321 [Faustovirus]|nr:hypothetical protein F-liban_321 [Faustovirus]SME65010.1 Hypothetical protein FSTVST1_313 [Faustovirus ST1]